MLLVDEACEQGDEERRRELDQQRHSDRQVVDRDEVEPLHECDADDPEGDEKQELAAADAERGSREREEEAEQSERGARRTNLRELERREAGVENDLRHAAVDREERRRGRDHRVAESRAVVRAPLGEQGGGVDHRPAGYPWAVLALCPPIRCLC